MSSNEPRWNLTSQISKADLTQVFSGGACNILDETGVLRRNTERDAINDWLTKQRLIIFDPQIHPDTHKEEYDYHKHVPLEIAARKAAKVTFYEISPRTFGGVTALELALDSQRWLTPTVIYFSDGNAGRDEIPAYSEKGHPLFAPYGIHERIPAVMQAHYREFRKNGTTMRRYLVRFAQTMDTLTVVMGDGDTQRHDVVISPYRMQATDLFKAILNAASGERTFVNFLGGSETRDSHGLPEFILPMNPSPAELEALLDQYVDEGNQLRRMIAKLLEVNVYLRIVYTQKAAIAALEELMRIKKILK
jgi:hypothetical protein